MSVTFTDPNTQAEPGAQPAQPAQAQQPAPQVQYVQPPQQVYYTPVQQQAPQPVQQPANNASKEDLAVLTGLITEIGVKTAIASFTASHPDAKELMPTIAAYTNAHPGIWSMGHEQGLEQAYKAVKYDAFMAQSSSAGETTTQTVDEINKTKAAVTATQGAGNASGASAGAEEEDYGASLVKMSRSANIFG